MAYTYKEDMDEQEKQLASEPLSMPAQSMGGGAPAPAATQGPTKQPGQGSGFVGWDSILNANKDNATARANQLAGGIAKSGQAAKTGLADAQKDYVHAANNRTPATGYNYSAPPNTGTLATPKSVAAPALPGAPAQGRAPPAKTPAPVVSPAFTATPQANAAPSPAGYGAADTTHLETAGEKRERELSGAPAPTKISPAKQAELDAVTSKQAPYSGPKSVTEIDGWDSLLSGARETQGKVQALQQRDALGNLRGEAGIEALMAPGKQSTGGSRLDAALLGSAGRKRFNELNADYGGLLKQYDDAAKSTRADAQTRTDKVASDTKAAQGRLDAYKASNPSKFISLEQQQADDALLLKGYIYFQNIQQEQDPAKKAALIEEYNRTYGGRGDSDAYARSEAAAERARLARIEKAKRDAATAGVNGTYEADRLRRGGDVVTSDHYTFS